ncbi:uncharacterized protein LOC107430133 [Ziziphus jujuba]|uniref:Uncharacterized protein LOC107430133 n=2 Tax=Ziziphus jujuba TaxID=326968 RepID=A0A6P4AMG6_ZIZJJ|nr:uncharacterized protein LOC107430133 [Ziziphus jujuba]KAH7513750.1 hypothetical protein FEM48_Zijuj11G0014500 [Ziziphus jujuba var. spinosa]
MGNCMETWKQSQKTEEMQRQNQQEEEEKERRGSGFVKESSLGKNSMRVKIVVTKEELEWLMLQLKNKGGKSLEDVLEEIERSREKAEGWKPSLESIMECPEVVEMDRSS